MTHSGATKPDRGHVRRRPTLQKRQMPSSDLSSANDPLDADSAHVAILLCTKNGGRFLAQQLDSIQNQSYRNWVVWASDDWSVDGTLEILQSYQASWGENRLSIRMGPGRGLCANFLSMACCKDIRGTHFAFADQDDIWDKDKLERALRWHKTISPKIPALYGSRTVIVDQDDRFLGYSPLFKRPPSFQNALVQNIAGGNTMLFNSAARSLLQYAGDQIDVVTHDWWLYLIVSGVGGKIKYDPLPSLRYRQHDRNAIGSGSAVFSRIRRLRNAYRGTLKSWHNAHATALRLVIPYFTADAQETFRTFESARSAPLHLRLKLLRASGVYRQRHAGDLALGLATLLGKI